MDKQIAKNIRKDRRQKRTRAKIQGTSECPRINVYKSNRYVYIQLIDDSKGVTLAAVHSQKVDASKSEAAGGKKSKAAFEAGKQLAEKAKALGVSLVVFDRGSFQYHGRIKSVAEGAREGGLIF